MVVPRISVHSTFQAHLLLVDTAFAGTVSDCFCSLFSGVLPFRTTSGNSVSTESSLLGLLLFQNVLYTGLFLGWGMAVTSLVATNGAVPSGYAVTCLLFSCAKPPRRIRTRWGGSPLMEVRAQNLGLGRPIIQGRPCLFLSAMISGKWLNPCRPQFPCLQNRR